MKNNAVTIIAAVIGAIATIVAAFIGKNVGEKNAVQQLYSQITTINGSNNTITVNSIDDFVAQYNKVINENETLKAQNSQYFADYTEQKNISDSLESQLGEQPVVSYNNLGLCIDGEDIPINKQKSIVTIDGSEYYSKELAEKFLNEDQNITIKDDTLFIGKVVADKANLIGQWAIEAFDCNIETTIKDSYGNIHNNALIMWTDGGITYNLDNKYDLLKLKISCYDEGEDGYEIITIKADEEIVYISPEINLYSKTIEADIPINKCSTLTITCNGSPFYRCIISDAIVYN